MPELNHTIVNVEDPLASTRFMTEVFGFPEAQPFAHFLVITTDNGVCLDFDKAEPPIVAGHYAFLVSDAEFDEIFARVEARSLDWWGDPFKRRPREIYTHFGGRGIYFCEPSGHLLEILTKAPDLPFTPV
jgi:catechol 2,3-dioxygenase-like lactoylglutathione lyase family enzyme